MAIPFSRTMRAVDLDDAIVTTVTALVATSIAALWLLWFLLAPFTAYEKSERIIIDPVANFSWRIPESFITGEQRVQKYRSHLITAWFKSKMLGLIHAGQTAQLILNTGAKNQLPIVAKIVDVQMNPNENGLIVVTAHTDELAEGQDLLNFAISGILEVSITKYTPATWMLTSMGL